MLTDPFHRKIDYLRVSVTDRCNLRCVYCLPEIYDRFTPNEEMLTDEETVFLVGCFAELGFSKIRVTGGEPLSRPGVEEIVRGIAQTPGVADVALSTNGVMLPRLARALAEAGLKRVNVSMDSLDADKFRRITRRGELGRVMRGVDLALQAGLSPVKINVVVARGLNEDEVGAFAALTEKKPLHVRFIELMPMGETGFFSQERHIGLAEMMERAAPLEPLPPSEWPRGHGPARYFRRPGGEGTVGFISALSCNFCSGCNRVRLTARGALTPCLDGEEAIDLRGPLRAGASRLEIQDLIRAGVARKPERHFMEERAGARGSYAAAPLAQPRFMCQVGG